MKEYVCKDDIVFDYNELAYIAPNDFRGVAKYFANQILAIPPADVRENETDKWEPVDSSCRKCRPDGPHVVNRISYRHTKCGKIVSRKENYCPQCGAKMF